jgi:hypothetical protein
MLFELIQAALDKIPKCAQIFVTAKLPMLMQMSYRRLIEWKTLSMIEFGSIPHRIIILYYFT